MIVRSKNIDFALGAAESLFGFLPDQIIRGGRQQSLITARFFVIQILIESGMSQIEVAKQLFGRWTGRISHATDTVKERIKIEPATALLWEEFRGEFIKRRSNH